MTPQQIKALLPYLTADELTELDSIVASDIEARPFSPLPGPQLMAYNSKADVVGFGGAAGGGKSFLAAGKALTQFDKSMILRRNGTELTAIVDEVLNMAGSRDGYNGQDKILRLPTRQIEFGSTPKPPSLCLGSAGQPNPSGQRPEHRRLPPRQAPHVLGL